MTNFYLGNRGGLALSTNRHVRRFPGCCWFTGDCLEQDGLYIIISPPPEDLKSLMTVWLTVVAFREDRCCWWSLLLAVKRISLS
jgi:hypothetical protein